MLKTELQQMSVALVEQTCLAYQARPSLTLQKSIHELLILVFNFETVVGQTKTNILVQF